jgi:hypothetical protein
LGALAVTLGGSRSLDRSRYLSLITLLVDGSFDLLLLGVFHLLFFLFLGFFVLRRLLLGADILCILFLRRRFSMGYSAKSGVPTDFLRGFCTGSPNLRSIPLPFTCKQNVDMVECLIVATLI